jgi:hypothetical protein
VTFTSTGGFNDEVILSLTDVNFPGCGAIAPFIVFPTPSTPATATLVLGANNCGIASLSPFEIKGHGSGLVSAGYGGAGKTRLARETGMLLAILCMAGIFYSGKYGRKRRLPRLAAMLIITLAGGLLAGTTGCGGYAASGGGGSTSNLTAGTYQVTITGADAVNSLVPPVSITVNVVVP